MHFNLLRCRKLEPFHSEWSWRTEFVQTLKISHMTQTGHISFISFYFSFSFGISLFMSLCWIVNAKIQFHWYNFPCITSHTELKHNHYNDLHWLVGHRWLRQINTNPFRLYVVILNIYYNSMKFWPITNQITSFFCWNTTFLLNISFFSSRRSSH